MAVPLESQVLGPLKQDAQFSDWWAGGQPTAIPFFDNLPLPITYTEVPTGPAEANRWVRAADAALTRFLALGSAVRHEATPLVLANYQQMLDLSDIEPLTVAEPTDIWRFVHPTAVSVTQDYVQHGDEWRAGDLYVQVSCECDWEEEHGLQLVFREGRMLTRVSDQDGHLTEGSTRPDPLMMKYYAAFGRPDNP